MTPPDDAPPDALPVARPVPPLARPVRRGRPRPAANPKSWRPVLIVAGVLGSLVLGGCVWGVVVLVPPAAVPEAARTAAVFAAREDLVAPYTGPADPAAAAEFRPFFESLAAAAKAKKLARVQALIDYDRMVTAAEVHGLGGELNVGGALGRAAAVAAVRANTKDDASDWWRDDIEVTTVHAVRYGPDRTTAVVFARHAGSPGTEVPVAKTVWWLARGPAGWRMYDCEELAEGYRTSAELVSAAALANGPDASRAEAALNTLSAAGTAWSRGDRDGTRAALELLDGAPLTPASESRKQEYVGLLAEEDDDSAAADDAYTRGLAAYPANAVLHWRRGLVRRGAGNAAGAAADAAAFRRLFGPDAMADLLEARIAADDGRTEDAAKLFDAAAVARPDLTSPLIGLAGAGRAARAGELAAAAATPAAALRMALGGVRAGDPAAACDLAAAFETARPQDPVGPAELAAALVRAGRYADAARAVGRAVARHRAAAEDAEDFYDPMAAYLLAMVDADRAVEAYAAVPRAEANAAFRTLADDLAERIADADDNAASGPTARLAALVGAHRKAAPKDPYADYVAGQLAVTARDAAAALPLFEKALTATADEDDAARFRTAWTGAMLDLDRGREAYAAGLALGPVGAGHRRRHFEQIAWRVHSQQGNIAVLERLVAAHRAADPADPRGHWWAGQARFLRRDYKAALTEYRAHRAAVAEEDHSSADWLTTERIVRCLVRLGRGRECAAELPPETGTDLWPGGTARVLAAAAAGDVDGTLAAVEKAAGVRGRADVYYADEDLGPILRSAPFAAFRAAYPPPAPGPADPDRAK